MSISTRIVIHLPLNELWTADGRRVDAVRLRDLGAPEVATLLREGAVRFVRADTGQPLEWIGDADRFGWWKSEARDRLVDPSRDAFALEDYPGEHCYRASEWRADGHPPILLFEHYH